MGERGIPLARGIMGNRREMSQGERVVMVGEGGGGAVNEAEINVLT